MRWTRGSREPSSCSSSPRARSESVSSRLEAAVPSASSAMRMQTGFAPCCHLRPCPGTPPPSSTLREKLGLRRFAILDTDANHGDGTRDLFRGDP